MADQALRNQMATILRTSAQTQQNSAQVALHYAALLESNNLTSHDISSMAKQLPALSLMAPIAGVTSTVGAIMKNNSAKGSFIVFDAHGHQVGNSGGSTSGENDSKKRKRERKVKDPNAPKRPPGAFFLFQQEVRKDVKEANPEMNGTEVTKEIGRMWQDLEMAEKKGYLDAADVSKAEYEKVKAEYEKENPQEEVGTAKGLPGRSKSAPSLGKSKVKKFIEESEGDTSGGEEEESEVDELEEEKPRKKVKMEEVRKKKGKENKGV